MQVMLACGDPRHPEAILVWRGQLAWPSPPRVGDRVRVPGPPGVPSPGNDVLRVSEVIFELDGTVYLVLEPAGPALTERLRFAYEWHPVGESL
ncbi:hypothetical protein GCM10027047_08020 [Rhodococcus aerolatus]